MNDAYFITFFLCMVFGALVCCIAGGIISQKIAVQLRLLTLSMPILQLCLTGMSYLESNMMVVMRVPHAICMVFIFLTPAILWAVILGLIIRLMIPKALKNTSG